MKSKIFALMLVLSFMSCPSWSNEYREGEVLAVFRVPEGVNVSAASESVYDSVSVIGASVSESYETLSEIEGKVIVLVRSDTMTTEELISSLKSNPNVISVSPNYYTHSQSVNEEIMPNDPSADLCWGLKAIRTPEVWGYTTGSKEVHVAIADSGIYRHPDLEANIVPSLSINTNTVSGEYDLSFVSWDSDLDGHGTHIAGTIGAVGDNGTGIAGVNWNVGLIAIRVFDTTNAVETISYEIRALNHAAMLLQNNPNLKIAAINFSLGAAFPVSPEDMKNNAYWLAFHALDSLNRTIIVVSAGNSSFEVGTATPFDDPIHDVFPKGTYYYPSSFIDLNNFIVVGAMASDDTAARFTNWGDNVDIAAPGVDIFSTYSPIPSDLLYRSISGTSMAAPHVTGAIALLMSAFPDASPSQIKSAILEGANRKKNPLIYPYAYNMKRLDAYIANLDDSIAKGNTPPESRDILIEQRRDYLERTYGQYKSFDGTAHVCRTGLLDVKAAYDILSSSSHSHIHSSSSGCNSGHHAVMILAVILAVMIALKRVKI